MQVFSSEWFKKHQKILLRLANSRTGRRILKITNNDLPLSTKIVKITPESFHWINKVDGKVCLSADIRSHPKYAKRLYLSLKPFWYSLHFIDWLLSFSPSPRLQWNFGFDTLTEYPAAGQNSPVDGYTEWDDFFDQDTFSNVRTKSGTAAYPSVASGDFAVLQEGDGGPPTNSFYYLVRSHFLFNTSIIGSTSTVDSATLSLYGNSKGWEIDNPSTEPALAIVSSNPASNDDLVAADHQNIGSTRFNNTDITYTNWSTSGYNDFTLNSSGLANIDKTGISKFGARFAYDLDGTPVPASGDFLNTDWMSGYFADESGTTRDPKLVVNYTLGAGSYSEEISISDVFIPRKDQDVSESISISDTFIPRKDQDVSESIDISDSTEVVRYLAISDSIDISDAVLNRVNKGSIDETIDISDTTTPALRYLKDNLESIDISDAVDLKDVKEISESIGISDVVTTQSSYARQFDEFLDINGEIYGVAALLRQKTAIAPVWILKCSFSTEIVYISDHVFTCDSLDGGITTVGWIKDWSSISEDISGQIGQSKVSDLTVQMLVDYDYTNNINELLWNLSEDVEAVDCELYIWVKELDGEDKAPIKMWSGNIIDYDQSDELNYRIQLVDQSVRLDKKLGNLVSTDEYAQLDPDDVGKMVPIVYGSVEQVPAIAIDAGALTTIAEDLDASETSFELTDASQFPTSGTIQIEDEQMTYTGKSNNTLTGITRAANSTTATTHDKGMQVGIVQSEYWYLLADHPVKAINSVYVDGVRQTGSDFVTYTDSDGKAKIKFTALPVLKKSVDVEVDDNMDVTDYPLSHNDGISHDAIKQTNQNSTQEWDYPSGFTTSQIKDIAKFAHPGYSYAEATYQVRVRASIYATTSDVTFEARINTLPAGSLGTVGPWEPIIFWKNDGLGFNYYETILQTFSTISSGDTYLEVRVTSGNPSGCSSFETVSVTRTVKAGASVTGTGVASKSDAIKDKLDGGKGYFVALQGNSSADAVIGTQITADVDGYEDDGSGTYTGTPNALIERPDHVIGHFLDVYTEASLSDFYTDAASFFSSKGYVFAGLINVRKNIRTWLNEMAWQCRCYFKFTAGQPYLLWRPDTLTPVTNISDKKIRAEGNNKILRGPRPSPLTELINVFEVLYNRDWTKEESDDAYQGILKEPSTPSTDPSVIRYGQKTMPELFRFNFVTDETMAQDLLTFYRNTYKDRKRVFEVEVYLDLFDLLFGQGVYLTPKDSLLCEIQTVDLFPGNGEQSRIDRVKLKLKES